RIPVAYGPRSPSSNRCLPQVFFRSAVRGETITVFGDGAQLRDFLYIDDLVRAFLDAAASDSAEGESFNVGSGTPVSIADLAHTAVDAAGRGRVKFVPWPDDVAAVETG